MYASLEDGVTWLLSIAPVFLVCLAAVAVGCVCGCRKKNPKNELLGLAGLVKLRNPESEYSYWSGDQQISSRLRVPLTDRNSYDSHQRVNGSVCGAVSRSLPDLPVGVSTATPDTGTGYPDTTSDLYATLDLVSDGAERKGEEGREGADQEAGPSHSPSVSYLQSSEERYARVGSEERIPAASAIAGIVPANHDLPYMTPPPQLNFSGDSHDSHKGYTSISVREPLSRIMRDEGIGSHAHYATLSDVDSDDMYAAIEENNGPTGSDTYARIDGGKEIADYATSESETYAQIGPSLPPIHPGPVADCEEEETGGGDYATSGSETYARIQPRSANTSAPPLRVDVSYTAQIHHSNANISGWSGATSPSSLRKEKREANSPLPEPPSPVCGCSGTTACSSANVAHLGSDSPLDAMYAKVIKKQKSTESSSCSPSSPPPQVPLIKSEERHYESLERPCPSEPPYEKINDKRQGVTDETQANRLLPSCEENRIVAQGSVTASSDSKGIGENLKHDDSLPFLSSSSHRISPDDAITNPSAEDNTQDLYAQVVKTPSPR